MVLTLAARELEHRPACIHTNTVFTTITVLYQYTTYIWCVIPIHYLHMVCLGVRISLQALHTNTVFTTKTTYINTARDLGCAQTATQHGSADGAEDGGRDGGRDVCSKWRRTV